MTWSWLSQRFRHSEDSRSQLCVYLTTTRALAETCIVFRISFIRPLNLCRRAWLAPFRISCLGFPYVFRPLSSILRPLLATAKWLGHEAGCPKPPLCPISSSRQCNYAKRTQFWKSEFHLNSLSRNDLRKQCPPRQPQRRTQFQIGDPYGTATWNFKPGSRSGAACPAKSRGDEDGRPLRAGSLEPANRGSERSLPPRFHSAARSLV